MDDIKRVIRQGCGIVAGVAFASTGGRPHQPKSIPDVEMFRAFIPVTDQTKPA